MKRPVKIVLALVLLLVLGLVFVASFGGENYRRKVEAYKHNLIARGEKLTVAELATPATGDSKRAKEFMDLMSGYARLTNPPVLMEVVAPGAVTVRYRNMTPDEMLDYSRNTALVEKLRTVLSSNNLGFIYDFQKPAETRPLPELESRIDGEALATATTIQALATNDQSEAKSALFACVDLVHSFGEASGSFFDFARMNMTTGAVGASWEALNSPGWNEPELSALQGKWEAVDLLSRRANVIRAERAFWIEQFVALRNTNVDEFFVREVSPDTGFVADLKKRAQNLYDRYPRYWKWRSTWSYGEELFVLQAADLGLKFVHQSASTEAAAPARKTFDRGIRDLYQQHPMDSYAGAWAIFLVPLQDYLTKFAITETARRITITTIALKRYQLAHQSYPASLSELVPQYLAQVPIDFMDGKPLRYKLQPDGNFLLYSVGEDGVDDGGDPTPTTGNSWLKGHDIVWPRAATAQEVEDYQKAQKLKVAATGNGVN